MDSLTAKEPPLSPPDYVMTGITPPSDPIEYQSGSVSPRPPTPPEATKPPSPSPIPSTPPGDGAITGYSYTFAHDPVKNPGHVLPWIPPPTHELDASWNRLVARLNAAVDVPQYSQLELDWVVSFPERCFGRYASSLHFWMAAAEQFNDHFDRRVSGKALREQFMKCMDERREGHS